MGFPGVDGATTDKTYAFWDPFAAFAFPETTPPAVVAPPVAVVTSSAPAVVSHKKKVAVYSDKLQGRAMSNGHKYDKNALSIAHPSLPLGTEVELKFGRKTVRATVTDRSKSSVVLSSKAARSLGVQKGAVVTVSTPASQKEPVAVANKPKTEIVVKTPPTMSVPADITHDLGLNYGVAAKDSFSMYDSHLPLPVLQDSVPPPVGSVPPATRDSTGPYAIAQKDSFAMYDIMRPLDTAFLGHALLPPAPKPLTEEERVAQMSPKEQRAYLREKTKSEKTERIAEARRISSEVTAVMIGKTNYNRTVSAHESGTDPLAVNPKSGATGMWQFLEQSWLGQLATNGAKYYVPELAQLIKGVRKTVPDARTGGKKTVIVWTVADPKLRKNLLELRKDPMVSSIIHNEFSDDNTRNLGLKRGEGYLAHFLGPGDFRRLKNALRDNPDQSAVDVLKGNGVVSQNRSLFYKSYRKVGGKEQYSEPRTVREFYDLNFNPVKDADPIVVRDRSDPRLKQAFYDAFEAYDIAIGPEKEQVDWWAAREPQPVNYDMPRESTAIVKPFFASYEWGGEQDAATSVLPELITTQI